MKLKESTLTNYEYKQRADHYLYKNVKVCQECGAMVKIYQRGLCKTCLLPKLNKFRDMINKEHA